jgi:hypothetical protein
VERIPNETTIVKNLTVRYLAFAQGHFDEVFIKEFISDAEHKKMLHEKGKRVQQRQVLLADVVFGHEGLSEEWRHRVADLVRHTQAFWHELRMAVDDSSEDREIGLQQPERKAAAEGHLCGMSASLNNLRVLLIHA